MKALSEKEPSCKIMLNERNVRKSKDSGDRMMTITNHFYFHFGFNVPR
jgi:hypothetical protein